MTSFIPREPYSQEELNQLYPKGLQLQLVQVFLRHGERTPVSARFQNAGLDAYWPYCNVARRLSYMAASKEDLSTWDVFRWRRKMEQFGASDEALIAVGPEGESEGICHPGELTDKGRQTTYALGQRLRHLYVNQLGFMPAIQSNADNMYLRTTPIPRAMESLQQTFWGMYPKSARTESFKIPTIVARSPAEETLFPNEGNCRRFRQLARMFAERAAERWNDSEEMEYLNSLWSKWMPSHSPRVAVDSRPRLSGIMDTINATLAHGPKTRLPAEFYDPKAREYIDKIAMDEWFAGYKESREYRKVGIGGLVGDITDRMVSTAAEGGWRPHMTPTGEDDGVVKFAISGCHDTTIAALLTSLGTFDNGRWPPYTSSVTVELFKNVDGPGKHRQIQKGDILEEFEDPSTTALPSSAEKQFSFLSFIKRRKPSTTVPANLSETARAPLSALPAEKLKDYYVRVKYMDQPVVIPGCAAKKKNHLPGDESFCTLEAFKEITDKFTPANWREDCAANSGKGMFEEGSEPAGF